jgi:hypothetical protein
VSGGSGGAGGGGSRPGPSEFERRVETGELAEGFEGGGSLGQSAFGACEASAQVVPTTATGEVVSTAARTTACLGAAAT